MNLLVNHGFEAPPTPDPGPCLVFPVDAPMWTAHHDNVRPPAAWSAFYEHKAGTWDKPEMHLAQKSHDARRVHSGEQAVEMFTFYRRHDAGLMQVVRGIQPGAVLRLSAYAHAWSNHAFDHEDNPFWSEGVGRDIASLEPPYPLLNDDPQNDAIGNFAFTLGVDPAGGVDPYAQSVVWGPPIANYNGHSPVPAVEATAAGDTVTVFLRSVTLWAFKHNNAYFDDVTLEVVDAPLPSGDRGKPRHDYARKYVVWPKGSPLERRIELLREFPDNTHGTSMDDAMIGDLTTRVAVVPEPETWGGKQAVLDFRDEHYPGVTVEFPDDGPPDPDPDPEPDPPGDTRAPSSLHLQTMSGDWQDYLVGVNPRACKVLASFEDSHGILRANPNVMPVVRQPVTNDYGDVMNPALTPREAAMVWIAKVKDALHQTCDQIERDYPGRPRPLFMWESINEMYASSNVETMKRVIAIETAMIEVLHEIEPRVGLVVYNTAVGNIEPHHYWLLIALARMAEKYGAWFGYHAYYLAGRMAKDWRWLAGRWTEIDKVLVDAGVHVHWYSGEGGAVGGQYFPDTATFEATMRANAYNSWQLNSRISAQQAGWTKPSRVFIPRTLWPQPAGLAAVAATGGYLLLPNDGWKSARSWNGNWDGYLADILEFDARAEAWNEQHGGRFHGLTLFTTGTPHFTGWGSFQIQGPEMRGLIQAYS